MGELFLVRHGESVWNRSRRYAGQQDVALSDLGRQQAFRIAGRLAGESLAAIYASPLRRARETAEIIARHSRQTVIVEPGLAEIDHGLWEGLTTQQVIREFPSHYDRWRSQPHTMVMPQGESLDDLALRALASLQRILAGYPGRNVAICAHDAVLRVLLLGTLGLGLEHFWKWSFENASLTVIQVHKMTDRDGFRLLRLNDTSHLDGVHSEYAAQAL
jgi:broad specificity phosphatase PhoE